jgi:hypothetical protein
MGLTRQFLLGKKIEKNIANSMKNVYNKKIAKKFEITNFKEKRSLLMNKTNSNNANIKHINNSKSIFLKFENKY